MLADAIRRILESLEAPYCLIGGHALAARGYLRFTTDYDFFTSDERILQRDVWNALPADAVVDPRRGDDDDPLAGVAHITTSDEEADVILAKGKWELDVIPRAEPRTLKESSFRYRVRAISSC